MILYRRWQSHIPGQLLRRQSLATRSRRETYRRKPLHGEYDCHRMDLVLKHRFQDVVVVKVPAALAPEGLR